jgi:hypothetical protein
MSAYIKVSTNEYPRHEGDIRLEYPDMGDVFVCPDAYSPVEQVTAPEIDGMTQVVFELPPVFTDGVWRMVWGSRNLTPEEIALREAMADPSYSPPRPSFTDESEEEPSESITLQI